MVKIKFGNKIYDNVNVKHLNSIDEASHSHPKRKKDAHKKKKMKEIVINGKRYKQIS